MSEIANSEGASESEKPVDAVQFPPFPDPKDEDFDEDIGEEERTHYKTLYKDLNTIKGVRLHCSACDRHMGCSARNEARMRSHPMLRTLVCHNCHIFYNSGEFEKGDDGSELYCRWCGQGGQVYCCSDCPHVFCAKCIKRNLGAPKIKEIENTDDWKCFKCNPKCLWDLRALCWAVLRYCDLKNKMAYQAQDLQLREALKKDCSIDYSECCKHKTNKRSSKVETTKKKEIKKELDTKSAANIISKIPSTIQVKKFAALNMDDTKPDKKPQKRSSSPKNKSPFVKNPINVLAPCTQVINALSVPPPVKKLKLPNPPMMNTLRLVNPNDRKPITTYTRIRAKPPQMPLHVANSTFNGFSANLFNNDNINLSLESLTQGLDMAAVASISQNTLDDDVVCTPDFPLEPLCEVTEDNDDDVQCITPGPVVAPKLANPPPLVPRAINTLNADAASDNIIQMTENDVTVNAATGGLKFRVDPQTLSSNKMYRLPDGRIFAINANPSMPGGYSATIVAVTEPTGKAAPKGATYAAKLSAVSTSSPASSATPKTNRSTPRILKRSTPKNVKPTKSTETSNRECDLNVPVEWYRYNLIDAVDALEYALSRLHKLKKEATTVYLRTRSINEMRNLHRTLERLLNTSSSRFGEIRDNLNKGLKQYVSKKSTSNVSEDDDDVEILADMDENDDPIFIDENSVESTMNGSENQEVDLTRAGSSEYNDSTENTKEDINSKNETDPLHVPENDNDTNEHGDVLAVLSNDNFVASVEKGLTSTDLNIRCEQRDDSNGKENESDNNTKENRDGNSTLDDKSNNIATENIAENIKEENKDDNGIIETVTESETKENTSDKNVKINETKRRVNSTENNIMENEIDSNVEENKINTDLPKNGTENHVNKNVDVTQTCDLLKSKNIIDDVNNQLEGAVNNADSKCKIEEKDKADSQDSNDKLHDTEISEEMIETLLKDDNTGDESASNVNSMDVSEVLQES